MVLCHMIRICCIYVSIFPLCVFTWILCTSARIAFCNKIFIRKFVRFIRINGGFVRLHCIFCMCVWHWLILSRSLLIRVKRIIRKAKGNWTAPGLVSVMVCACVCFIFALFEMKCNQYVVVNISVCRKSIAKFYRIHQISKYSNPVFQPTTQPRQRVWNTIASCCMQIGS